MFYNETMRNYTLLLDECTLNSLRDDRSEASQHSTMSPENDMNMRVASVCCNELRSKPHWKRNKEERTSPWIILAVQKGYNGHKTTNDFG